MKERFKRYLEEQFRSIAPTKEAMEYRKATLTKMLDRAQELRIKGIVDEDLIYNMVVGELGDFESTLHKFESDNVKKEITRRTATVGAIVGVSFVALLTLVYVIVGCVAKVWHPTWLILVDGILFGLVAIAAYVSAKFVRKKWYNALRVPVAVGIVLLSVAVFLLLQVVGNVAGSYLTFLAMVVALSGADLAISFAMKSKARWEELPVFTEILCVMLYVVLNLSLGLNGLKTYWHPAWILCLGGFVVAIVESIVFSTKKEEKKSKENTNVNEEYWTKWDD